MNRIWLYPSVMFVPPNFKGVLFNPYWATFEAYHKGRMIAWVSWIYLYQAMHHPVGRQVFLERYGSLPGQWLAEAKFPPRKGAGHEG